MTQPNGRIQSNQNTPLRPTAKVSSLLRWGVGVGFGVVFWANLVLAQQTMPNLQWLPHPAVVAQTAQSVERTAAQMPSNPSSEAISSPELSSQRKENSLPTLSTPFQGGPPKKITSPPPPFGGGMKHPLDDPFQDVATPTPPQPPIGEKPSSASPAPLPKATEPPYLPEHETHPIPGAIPGGVPTSTQPTQVRAECITDANLLLPIDKLNTRIDIDPHVHPQISPEEETRLRQVGQPTRLDQLRRAKAEFDAKMWCEPPASALPDRMTKGWPETTMTWKASALCHKPLYFEQLHLERYGHSTGPLTQPIVSAGHFYLMIPTLPYQLALWPPYECMYPLGHYRPGSCAPYYLDPIPLSIRAALAEAGAWVGGVFLVP